MIIGVILIQRMFSRVDVQWNQNTKMLDLDFDNTKVNITTDDELYVVVLLNLNVLSWDQSNKPNSLIRFIYAQTNYNLENKQSATVNKEFEITDQTD